MRSLLSIPLLFVVVSCQSLPSNDPQINVEELVKSRSSWDGSLLPAYENTAPEITILKITIPPGFALPLHKHPVINAGVLLEGELTVTTDLDEVLHLSAGDAIVEVVDRWHFGKNEGREPAVILVFYAGTPGKPLTVKH